MMNHAAVQFLRPWLFLTLCCLVLAAGAAPKIRVACVGASITYGSGIKEIPMLRQVAAATSATVIDLYSAMGNQSIFQADGVHPNEAGAKLLSATIYRAVTGSEPPVANAKGS